ncbi:TPA: hypothetical protein ACOFC4_001911 [Stenotrophomonas maltophilia]|uniref:hypothetical protein n=1 Tax=Stenotrophomonas maltophilia TaxID=40324 RepID=UPI001FA7C6C8|nr:hypothetical protein [Stenotrophomonas maltophilia]
MIRWTTWKVIAIVGVTLLSCMETAQSHDRVEVRSPQRLDALIDALVTTPSPISPAQLHELGFIAPFSFEKDAGPRIYRSQPMLTADGYAIDNVEYRVIRGKDDDIRLLFVTFVDTPCFPLERLAKRYTLQPFIYPPSHGAPLIARNHEQHHSLTVGAQEIIVRSQRDAPHCVLGLRR